jgi:hypothetical protein
MPPPGFPEWLIPALSVVLSFVYQKFVKNLPGTTKFLLTWGLSGVITLVLVVLIYHVQGIGDILKYLTWMWACMQFVYQLFVKPETRIFNRKVVDTTKP